MIEQIEFWHNKASDTKFVWCPFGFLKPEANVLIGNMLKLKMTLCFGLYYGLFAAIRSWLFSNSDLLIELARDTIWALLFFAFWFNAVTAPIWNMRAKKLQRELFLN
jgi:hypothetical protein